MLSNGRRTNTYRLFQKFAPPEEPLSWKNSTLIAEDALDAIPRLKAESPVPLRSHGSIAMNRALLLAGLVDVDLELVDSQVYDGRMQQPVYVPTIR